MPAFRCHAVAGHGHFIVHSRPSERELRGRTTLPFLFHEERKATSDTSGRLNLFLTRAVLWTPCMSPLHGSLVCPYPAPRIFRAACGCCNRQSEEQKFNCHSYLSQEVQTRDCICPELSFCVMHDIVADTMGGNGAGRGGETGKVNFL